MTEFQIISAIRNYVTSEEGVTDFPASSEQIGDEVDTLRARLISEQEAGGLLRRPFMGFTQAMTINLKDVDSGDSVAIPQLFTKMSGMPAVAYAGGTDLRSPFRQLWGSQLVTGAHDMYIGEAPAVWFGQQEIRVLDECDSLLLIGIFEDPSALAAWGYDDGFPPAVEGEGSQYPIPGKMTDIIIGKTAESYLRHMYRIFPQANRQVDLPQGPGNAKGR